MSTAPQPLFFFNKVTLNLSKCEQRQQQRQQQQQQQNVSLEAPVVIWSSAEGSSASTPKAGIQGATSSASLGT